MFSHDISRYAMPYKNNSNKYLTPPPSKGNTLPLPKSS